MTAPFEISIVGTGNWGTTLAVMLARGGRRVSLIARSPAEAETLRTAGSNERFLPGVPFPPELTICDDPALCGAPLWLIVTPSKTMRTNARALAAHIPPEAIVLSGSKGFDPDSLATMSTVIAEELPTLPRERIGALSGPNIAKEIANGLPATSVVALADAAAAQTAQQLLSTSRFRVYRSNDVFGVELAGALKNIIALGAGIIDGMAVGENAKAAFLTRGLAEITRLGMVRGAHPLTFAGLAGLGDLLATCSSPHSRNRRLGEALARGTPLEAAQVALGQVAEGVNTTVAACQMARVHAVELPIAEAMYRVLFEDLSAEQAAVELMQREPKDELAGFDWLV